MSGRTLSADRPGPINFRMIIQPTIVIILGIPAGLKDAPEGQPPFLPGITNPASRPELLHHGSKDVGNLFVILVVLDGIYQLIVQRGVYILELLIVATTLAIIPYVLVRGPVSRIRKR